MTTMMHDSQTEKQESSGEYQTYLRLYLPSPTEQQRQQLLTQSTSGVRQVVTRWRELPANPLMSASYRRNTPYKTHNENVHWNANMGTNYMYEPPQSILLSQHNHQYMPNAENNMQQTQGNDYLPYYHHANSNNNFYDNSMKNNNDYFFSSDNRRHVPNNWENNYNFSYSHQNDHFYHNKQWNRVDNAQKQYPLPSPQKPLPSWQHGRSSSSLRPSTRSSRDHRKDVDKYANKPFHCDACQKGFNTEAEYEVHRASHLYCTSPGCHFTCRKDKPWKMEEHVMLLHNRPNAPDLLDSEKYLAQRRQRFPTHHTVESKVEELYYQAARGVALPGERRRWLRQHGIIIGKRPRVLGNVRGNTFSAGKSNISYVIRGQPPSLTSTLTSSDTYNMKSTHNVNCSTPSDEIHNTHTNNTVVEITSRHSIADIKEEELTVPNTEMLNDEKVQVKNDDENRNINKIEKINTLQEHLEKNVPLSNENNGKEQSNAIHCNKNNRADEQSVSFHESKKYNNIKEDDNDHADNAEEEDVPSYYVCHRCSRKGTHHVRNCPTRHDSTFDRHIVWGEAKLETSRARKRARGQQAKREVVAATAAAAIVKDNCIDNVNNNTNNTEKDQATDYNTNSMTEKIIPTIITVNINEAGGESNNCMSKLENGNIIEKDVIISNNEFTNGVMYTHSSSNNFTMEADKPVRHDDKKQEEEEEECIISTKISNNKSIYNNNNCWNIGKSDDDLNDNDNPPPSVSAKQIDSLANVDYNFVNDSVNVATDVIGDNKNSKENKKEIDNGEQCEGPTCKEDKLTEQPSLSKKPHQCSNQDMHERTRVLAPVAASRLANRRPQPHSRSNTHMHKSNHTRRLPQLENTAESISAAQLPSLYARLTEEDHINERGVLLQAIHYFVTNNFFC